MSRRTTPIVLLVLCLGITAAGYGQTSGDAGKVSPRDEYITDASGARIGLTVHAGALQLTLRAANHQISAGSLAISKVLDGDGRELALLLPDGSPAASFSVAKSGRIESLELKNGMKLTLTPMGKELYDEVLSFGEGLAVHQRALSTASRLRPSDVSLDMVADALKLGASWAQEVTTVRNASGTLTTVMNAGGAVILYIVHYGPDQAAFDAKGNVVFLDVFADIYHRPPAETEDWADIQTLVPDHLLVTTDGRVGAYVWTPAPAAIRAFWDDRDVAGNTTYMYRAGLESSPRPLIPSGSAPR